MILSQLRVKEILDQISLSARQRTHSHRFIPEIRCHGSPNNLTDYSLCLSRIRSVRLFIRGAMNFDERDCVLVSSRTRDNAHLVSAEFAVDKCSGPAFIFLFIESGAAYRKPCPCGVCLRHDDGTLPTDRHRQNVRGFEVVCIVHQHGVKICIDLHSHGSCRCRQHAGEKRLHKLRCAS